MGPTPSRSPSAIGESGPLAIAVAGAVALAVAMGIGRFAFTPILPMMLSDGVISLSRASWLASANYLGYLLGAVLCTLQPFVWARWPRLPHWRFATLIRAGLVATGVLTLAMSATAPGLWPVLRFSAGVASAIVFVFTSGWCMSQLAQRGVPALAGLIYVGPGAGIFISGLVASGMVAVQWRAAAAWLIFGLLAWVLTAAVWRRLHGPDDKLAARSGRTAATAGHASNARFELPVLALAYGFAGFGYIITATFLPVIARTALPGSAWLDLFWPIFGLAVMAGSVLATRVPSHIDRRWLLAACYVMQAAGVVASLVSPNLGGFVAGSLLLGLPFTAITFFAMQEVRRLRPDAAASLIGLLTATYGVGQILGPPLVAVLMQLATHEREGFSWSLVIAAATLGVGAMLFAALARVCPLHRTRAAAL